jgi:hypothetical protein
MMLIVGVYPMSVKAEISESYFLANGILNSPVSDTDFIDTNAMNVDQIQSFLSVKGSFLKDFSENGRSAAQIIYDAAKGYEGASGTNTKYGITINSSTGTVSPRILLIYLQKEQSLVTATTRDDSRLKIAMGYGCPDGKACDLEYYGFTNQVDNAAWQLRYVYERAQGRGYTGDYQVGNTIPINDTIICGNLCGLRSVTMSKRSTASIYSYTPHVFYSAYNVWKFYQTWFGSDSHSDSSLNDTANFTLRTYDGTEQIMAGKASDSRAYLNNQLLADLGTTTWTHEFTGMGVGTNSFTIEYRNSGGTNVGNKQIQIVVRKRGDVNGDGNIDIQDLSIFASYWNQTNPEESLANQNPKVDYIIDVLDLSILAQNWGK